ncbi:MAG TPA: hypothetical protein VKR58_07330, partial [Aquella sp.]|nr:hypothetical protein [Aquella sp.]
MWLKYATYTVFIISILSLWIPAKTKLKPWKLTFAISLVLAYASHIANPIAILSILLFYVLVSGYSKSSSKWKYILWILVFALGLTLELHFIPGFKNLLIWDKIKFTPDATPFTLYLNFDKASVGLIILGLTLNMASNLNEWKALLKQVAFKLPIVIFVILILTIAFGYTKFEPKVPHGLWIWAISNLLFACLAEEGFFR